MADYLRRMKAGLGPRSDHRDGTQNSGDLPYAVKSQVENEETISDAKRPAESQSQVEATDPQGRLPIGTAWGISLPPNRITQKDKKR
jgi:hypothetical protein